MKRLLSAIILVCAGSFAAVAGPYINANPAALNSFSYTNGAGPSASQVVVLQSSILGPSSGNVLVTSPADYEISLNNSSFSSSVSIPFANDTLGATNVYVRLKSGLANGNYNNEILAVTSPGANANVSLNGLVTTACTVMVGAITATTAAFTWNATGATSYEVKIDNAAAAPTAAGIATSTTSYSATGLTAGTNYYFHIRGNGGGSNFTSWTTQAFTTKSTGVKNTNGNNYSISVLPNPNNGQFTVYGLLDGITTSTPVHVSVVNTVGQVLYAKDATLLNGAFTTSLELPGNIAAGTYMVNVSCGNKHSAVRFNVVK